jgi:hypothetical protein
MHPQAARLRKHNSYIVTSMGRTEYITSYFFIADRLAAVPNGEAKIARLFIDNAELIMSGFAQKLTKS